MGNPSQSTGTRHIAIPLAVIVIWGLVIVPTLASGAPSVSGTNSIASDSDVTEQSFKIDVPLGPTTITCTLNTSAMRNRGVTIKSATVSGSTKIAMSVNNDGDIDVTIKPGSGTVTATATIRANTNNVQIPNKRLNHTTQCGGASTSTSTQSDNQGVEVAAEATAANQPGYTIEETGIQNTTKTQIHSEDTTFTTRYIEMTQSLDLDLILPDDGDRDSDTYNITIDTSDSRAHGINVTGASVEQDPSGPNNLIEVVDSTVTATENVTVTLREAPRDQSNGNLSHETITIGLDLNATQHAVGQSTITHIITDDAGHTTTTVSYTSNISSSTLFTASLPGASGQGPPTNLDNDPVYEDINGDGQGTFEDAIALAFAQTGGLTQAQKDALDHDGDGDVDFDDAIDLAFDAAIV